ncbi:phosphoribosylpyrophosphate synthetase [Candidatus Kaiserbacteria bacterium CG10_big_fil_rev_8_21_14_0_10_51_14]|uniref:ribose-phosphate diphosphokinase n=1 Tax=Candidatus Kaiserbacteria bacterium CG10_big_fil_rev_8_21_14_0_10_51_14 TaxID=1974610 RepID=A0A2H0UE64_9BACT|nr:MAG: phosphoribosylpyrophosphate synthetase [Candidatus Kaiserbacteria bacterium CG10_big_fil_rev_8_21_14_0_10_51_14]
MEYKIFSLGANDGLAQKIADKLGMPLGEVKWRSFSDGEQQVQFLENLRGKNVFLIQPTNPPAENWIRLLLAIDAAHGASAHEITAVVPYFGYSRQDRKSKSREPISARVMATTIEKVGATRLLTMDLHNDAIGGFFRKTLVDNLYARRVFVPYLKDFFSEALKKDELVVVSPDAGGVVRAQSYGKRLMKDGDLAIIHKEREIPNKVARMKLIGDVKGKITLIVDDIADTCGTLARAADLLVENGAREVYAIATHGLFSGDALATLEKSPIKKIFITNTLAYTSPLSSKVEVVSVDSIFADAIERIDSGESLSELFETD